MRSKKKIYREGHTLLKTTVTVLGTAIGETSGASRHQLSPATHEFPFTFKLPAALPGSCRFSDFFSTFSGEVSYKLQARVDAPGWLDNTLTKTINILGNYAPGPTLAPKLKPFSNTKTGSKSFLGSSGRLEVTVTAPSGAILLGAPVKLGIKVQNGTKVKLVKLRFKLKTHVTVTAIEHTDMSWATPLLVGVLSSAIGPEVSRTLVTNAESTVDGSITLQIPNTATTTHKSPRLTTAHSIEVEFVPEGWLHRSLCVSVPVFVLAPGGGLESVVGSKGGRRDDAMGADRDYAEVGSDDVRAALSEVSQWGGKKQEAAINTTTPKGHTALHLACLRSQPSLVRALIAHGCDPAAKTNAGFTALHSAAFGGDSATCIAVLEGCPPDLNLKFAHTAKKSTPMDLARKDIPPDSPANPRLAALIDTWPQLTHDGDSADVIRDDDDTDDDANTAGGNSGSPEMAAEEIGEAPASSSKPVILKWMADSDSAVCMACQGAFSLFNRRHHCRGCGVLVCASCSPKWAPSGSPNPPQRTCPKCRVPDKPT